MAMAIGRTALGIVRRAVGFSTLMDIRDRLSALADIRADLERIKSALISGALPSDMIVVRHGLTLLLDPTSQVDRAMIEGDWETSLRTQLFEYTNRFFPEGECTFLDIGSYFGLYSLHAARSSRFVRVFAFESDRLNFAQLQGNIFLNRATDKILAHNCYVYSRSGETIETTASYAMAQNRGGVGRYGVKEDQQRIGSVSIDELLKLHDQSIVAKIDAEDGEHEVLKGMKDTIANNRVLIQVECSNKHAILETCEAVGLRYLSTNYDHYFTNLPA